MDLLLVHQVKMHRCENDGAKARSEQKWYGYVFLEAAVAVAVSAAVVMAFDWLYQWC